MEMSLAEEAMYHNPGGFSVSDVEAKLIFGVKEYLLIGGLSAYLFLDGSAIVIDKYARITNEQGFRECSL